MQYTNTTLKDVFLITPAVYRDNRGFFSEIFRVSDMQPFGLSKPFIQDNHARSEQQGVLRGLHFQLPPHAQTKLVWAVRGSIYDLVLDLRKKSPTYGQWESFTLSAENFKRLLVPAGFAHGYMTLETGTEVQYKVDTYYNPESDRGIRWNDPALAIAWPDLTPVLSEKDKNLPVWADFESPF